MTDDSVNNPHGLGGSKVPNLGLGLPLSAAIAASKKTSPRRNNRPNFRVPAELVGQLAMAQDGNVYHLSEIDRICIRHPDNEDGLATKLAEGDDHCYVHAKICGKDVIFDLADRQNERLLGTLPHHLSDEDKASKIQKEMFALSWSLAKYGKKIKKNKVI